MIVYKVDCSFICSQFVDLLGTIIESSPTFLGQMNDDDDSRNEFIQCVKPAFIGYEGNSFTDLCLKWQSHDLVLCDTWHSS